MQGRAEFRFCSKSTYITFCQIFSKAAEGQESFSQAYVRPELPQPNDAGFWLRMKLWALHKIKQNEGSPSFLRRFSQLISTPGCAGFGPKLLRDLFASDSGEEIRLRLLKQITSADSLALVILNQRTLTRAGLRTLELDMPLSKLLERTLRCWVCN